MFFPFGKRSLEKRDESFPDSWLGLLRENVLFYHTLSEADQARLRERTAALIGRLNWEGCAGQAITDEVKVTIAGQAALLLLGIDGYLFDELHTVLVYPGSFLRQGEDELGYRDEIDMPLGEALHGGPVALSWWHARWGGRQLEAENVVLHEFAHKLAELGDAQAGRPALVEASLAKRWRRVMQAARDRLGEDADYGRPTLFDPYGAESLSEFFAVATETFFQRPAEMKRRHRDVYELLAACYRQDPASRTVPAEVAESARTAAKEYSRHAIRECTAALRHRPDYLDAYRQRADHRMTLGDVDGAVADLGAVVGLVKGDEERAEALYERGAVLYEAGRLEEALADFTAAIGLCPEFAVAYADRGAIHAERGERGQALADLNEAVRLDPRDDAALFERARLNRDAGELARALADLDRAAKLCPDDAEVFRERAEVYEALGRHDGARRDRETAGRLDGET
jgi:Mlc titration factor MtfA (ptsG expression regulator)